MTSQYRHRRTSNPATPAPNPIEPGEIAVNTANRQLHLGDAASATLGTPKALIAIRYFDTAAQYVVNDFVVNGTALYRAKNATGPGAFTASDWAMMVGTIDPQYVAKAGDVMTGALSLPAVNPTAGVHATNKTYVDNLVALKSSVIVSDVKPAPDPIDSTLWYNTLDGQMYIRYNDGNSTQWVIATPQPDAGQVVQKSGDTMTGNLVIAKSTFPKITLNANGGTAASGLITGERSGVNRWALYLGNDVAETGSNVGSDFLMQRFTDAGAAIDNPLVITRSTGVADFAKKPTVAGAAWAAPLDALAYSGIQVNGSMEVSQENGTNTLGWPGPAAATKYLIDGWTVDTVGGSLNFAAAKAASTVSGFSSMLAFWVSAAFNPVGSEYATIRQPIEGLRWSRLGWGTASGQSITVGFWVKPDIATGGVMSLVIKNTAGTRSYCVPITVTTGWQYKTVTIPPCPDGVWGSDNTAAAHIMFTCVCGTTYTAPSANAWLSGNYVAAPGQTSIFSTGLGVSITGVVVLPGVEAPSATRSSLIMRPYDQELVTCQRYWRKVSAVSGIGYSPTNWQATISCPGMRAVPVVGCSSPGINITDTATNYPQSTIVNGIVANLISTLDGGLVNVANYSGLTPNRVYMVGSGAFTVDARL